MTTTQCATTCVGSAWFAMQRGRCQCASSLASGPQYKLVPSEECGAICPGEEGISPTRYCGGDGSPADAAAALAAPSPARNAIYTQTSCFLGGRVEVTDSASLGRSDEGQVQWRGRIQLQNWREATTVTLDWGGLAVEIYSLWGGANYASKGGAGKGPLVSLILKGGKAQEIGFKARGGAEVHRHNASHTVSVAAAQSARPYPSHAHALSSQFMH